MKTEVRLLAAVGLMILVMVATNWLFPPIEPEPVAPAGDSAAVAGSAEGVVGDPSAGSGGDSAGGVPGQIGAGDSVAPAAAGGVAGGDPAGAPEQAREARPPEQPLVERRDVVVESPIYRFTFDNYGAALTSAQLLEFESLADTDGPPEPVELIPVGTRSLENRIVVGQDTISLEEAPFSVEPEGGLDLTRGDTAQTLTFHYDPSGPFAARVSYTFEPASYAVAVETEVNGVARPLLFTTLGHGLGFNDADSAQEAQAMAYVVNHLQDGIEAENLEKVEERELLDGPFLWAAFKSRYFVSAILPGSEAEAGSVYLGGVLVLPEDGEHRAGLAVAHPVAPSGITPYQVFLGPQEYAALQELGADMEEVNPYGWRFFRPIIRPFVGAILWCLTFLHDNLMLGYGWVLILFGVLLRILLWPLYMKAMRAQIRNMAVQPLVKEIQTKYKDNPERLQKEMMKLYKEHGFNPLGGCLPMLLPWPILIALFFVFQNTIELRGVEFLWMPDLSAKDPFYILPIFLAVSMFLLQWVSLRSMPESNPQMKVMMWFMPLFFGFIFLNFPSGLNLYYASMNIATLPQQIIVANERKKAKPINGSGGSGGGGSGGGSSGKSGGKGGKGR